MELKPLSVLQVEDSEDDAELVLLHLRRNGYKVDAVRVDTAEAMREALANGNWDIVIADYSMPRFDGIAALKILTSFDQDLPLILVSGTVGEDIAVEAMKSGASDYIMKDNLTRLAPAVERELRERDHRRKRQHAETALFHEREKALVTLHSIGDGVITTDANSNVEFINPIAEQLTAWSLSDARGRPLMEIFPVINEATRKPLQNPADICLHTGCVVSLDEQSLLINRCGEEIPITDSAAPIRDQQGNILGTVLVFHDVSRERHLAHQISWQETHDALTGLVNRCEFEKRLVDLLDETRANKHHSVLLYIDLDQFKVINDTCGHVAGDELLKQISALFQQHLPDNAIFARLGGDEFGILLPGFSQLQGSKLAEQLLEALRSFHFHWEASDFEVLVSIGLAGISSTSESAAVILSAADVACYVAKDTGRNRVHIYREEDIEQARRHSEMQWVSRVTQALEEDRFELYCQRITPLSVLDNTRHHELLIRMHDRDGNTIPPGAFIPAAERYNLMPTLDRWVIRTAFAMYSESGMDLESLSENGSLCSINLSGTSLSDTQMLSFIKEQIAHHRIPPSMLCFEITETAAIANLTRATEFIRELRTLGCRFALDDFGSGLSSFAYLKSLPVDFLKIDGYFVKDMVNDPIDHAMVEAINDIGHVMGMKTIAEFVENEAILTALHSMQVDYAQGYGIGHPRPFNEAMAEIFPDTQDQDK